MRSNVKQGGFTLIELVVVITILGILAAFAVPRFVALEGEARSASAQALGGSLRSAAALAHAMQLATGTADNGSVDMEGNTIDLANGYPDAATVQDALSDYTGYTPSTSGTTTTFTNDGDSGCTVDYTEAANPGEAPAVAVTC